MAGLVATVSKVPTKWRAYAAKSTNLAESGHWEDYTSVGISCSLLAAILGLRRHIQDKTYKLEISSTIGVSSTWTNRTPMARMRKAYARKDRSYKTQAARRQQNPALPWNPQNPYDSPSAAASARHMRSMSADGTIEAASAAASTRHMRSMSADISADGTIESPSAAASARHMRGIPSAGSRHSEGSSDPFLSEDEDQSQEQDNNEVTFLYSQLATESNKERSPSIKQVYINLILNI